MNPSSMTTSILSRRPHRWRKRDRSVRAFLPAIACVTTRVADGLAAIEMRQDAYRLSADQFSRLADLEWSERPGGIPAGTALAAAARIAQAHGGSLDARRTDGGGCVLILTAKM